MKRLLGILILFFLFSCSSNGQKPTNIDITNALKKIWEKAEARYSPKVTITINDIKFGTSEKSNLSRQYDGIPKGALITNAKIDFTENTFYSGGPQGVRRIMTALVYKDQFGDWTVMNAGCVYPDR